MAVAGSVRLEDGAAPRTLPGVSVAAYRADAFDCRLEPPGPVFGRATTDSDGRYRIALPPGEYLVAAFGGPECLPMRWHVGASDPGVADACGARIIGLLSAGLETTNANVLFTSSPGCP